MKKTDIVLDELQWFRNILQQGEGDAEYYEAQVDVLTKAIKLLEQLEWQTDGDKISRQAAIDAVKKNTFRLTFAEEQNCEGHVAWSANAVYSDVIEGELLELPSAQIEIKNDEDTISRQAAINIANDLIVKISGYEQHNHAINSYCVELMNLPSAHSEQTDVQKGTSRMNDLISSLSEIRSQYNCFDESKEPYYHALSEAIKELSRRVDGDTISRQAAIDAVKNRYRTHEDDLLELIAFDIERLPSTYPERKTGEWISIFDEDESKCSECGEEYYYPKTRGYNYCPNCGSDNRGEKEK